jgi:hypothetical protein
METCVTVSDVAEASIDDTARDAASCGMPTGRARHARAMVAIAAIVTAMPARSMVVRFMAPPMNHYVAIGLPPSAAPKRNKLVAHSVPVLTKIG